MAVSKFHRCDDGCVCPECGELLIYAPALDEHACQDIDCIHGHGVDYAVVFEQLLDLRLRHLDAALLARLDRRCPDEWDLAWLPPVGNRRVRRFWRPDKPIETVVLTTDALGSSVRGQRSDDPAELPAVH